MKISKAELADTWYKRALGLMFRTKQEKPLIFKLGRESLLGANIHCCFMRFPIDVLFLNAQKCVVDKALNVKPWTLNVAPRKPAKYIIEFPVGQGTAKLGEQIEWKE
ncbi:DUF192 domain-containing protein [archaeon]|nr:DUF192 domain-containing protein [archaeon]